MTSQGSEHLAMTFKLTQAQLYEIKTRIEDIKKLDNMKYLNDISKIINPDNKGIKLLNSLTENQYLELVQYIENVEAKYKEDYSIVFETDGVSEHLDLAYSGFPLWLFFLLTILPASLYIMPLAVKPPLVLYATPCITSARLPTVF